MVATPTPGRNQPLVGTPSCVGARFWRADASLACADASVACGDASLVYRPHAQPRWALAKFEADARPVRPEGCLLVPHSQSGVGHGAAPRSQQPSPTPPIPPCWCGSCGSATPPSPPAAHLHAARCAPSQFRLQPTAELVSFPPKPLPTHSRATATPHAAAARLSMPPLQPTAEMVSSSSRSLPPTGLAAAAASSATVRRASSGHSSRGAPRAAASSVSTAWWTPAARQLGKLYMASCSTASAMDRRPRAPVAEALARWAMARRAPNVTCSCTPSAWKRAQYCLSSAFLGLDMTWTICSSVSSCSWVVTGKRPTNSGRKPYAIRSSTCTGTVAPPDEARPRRFDLAASPTTPANGAGVCAGFPMEALKPMWVVLARSRLSITACRPEKAPPQMKSMFEVSMATCSPRGFLRPPRSGTLTTAPSSILSSACWTPSPDTSRVCAMASVLRANLSTSSR
mmetsp:Transcript_6426/g.21141  ORF Transcript_6426/g.21141 Transcript_6426/m.21141 type:complete len:456 (-) Transcript_6426:1006-2373(-)